MAKEFSLEEMVTEFNKWTYIFSFWVFYGTDFKCPNVVICFDSHKLYMKIQEVMMKQLGCITWEQVTEDYRMMTSSYKALSEYFIAYQDWVSIFLLIGILLWYILLWLSKVFFCCNY